MLRSIDKAYEWIYEVTDEIATEVLDQIFGSDGWHIESISDGWHIESILLDDVFEDVVE